MSGGLWDMGELGEQAPDVVGGAVPGEMVGAAEAALSEGGAEGRLGEEEAQPGGDLLFVGGVDQEGSVARDFGKGGGGAGEDRRPAGHRLHRRQAEPLK